VLGILHLAGSPFLKAQIAATGVAMTFNFLLNNVITYRDRRLRGRKLVSGLLLFYAACTVGALSNFGLAQLALGAGIPWYLAGPIGMIVSSVWNYGVSAVLTWRQGRAQGQPQAPEPL
jgi:dolichol-phosphate mannosyltransferase